MIGGNENLGHRCIITKYGPERKEFVMASSVQAYAITITNGITGAAPADGFVDPSKLENYGLDFKTTPSGLTFALCQAKRRGNLRWTEIINQLGMVTNCHVHRPSIVSDATATTEATSVAFQIYVQYGDAALTTSDELVSGQNLSGIACIKRCVARGLAATLFRQIDIVDPTGMAGAYGGGTASVPRIGSRINVASSYQIAPYASVGSAEALVAVTKK